MLAKTLHLPAVLSCLVASFSSVGPANAAELWEIFAPTTEVSGSDSTRLPEHEAVFASDLVEPSPVVAAPSVGEPSSDSAPATAETAAVWVAPDVQEPVTATVFASDLETTPSLLAPPHSAESAAAPSGEKELWAIFAPDATTRAGNNASGFSSPEILLESGERLRITQAVEEIPPAYSDAFSLPPTVTSAASSGDESMLDRPIFSLTLNAAIRPELREGISNLDGERAIEDLAVEKFGSWEAPQYEASMAAARFAGTEVHWAAPAVYSRPLYFEQPNLERYGHHVAFCKHDNLTQSAISAAHFFVTVPALPYAVGANGTDECNYVLGSYRPGSCNPHQIVKPKRSVRGLLFEGAAVTGLVFLIP